MGMAMHSVKVTTTPHDCVPADIACVIDHLLSTSTSAANIKGWAAKDPTLSCVHCFLLSGWPTQQLSKDFQSYVMRKNELSILDSCILLASPVVILHEGQELCLIELHDTHALWSQQDEGPHSVLHLAARCGLCMTLRIS